MKYNKLIVMRFIIILIKHRQYYNIIIVNNIYFADMIIAIFNFRNVITFHSLIDTPRTSSHVCDKRICTRH